MALDLNGSEGGSSGDPATRTAIGGRFTLRQRLIFILALASLPGMAVAVFLAVHALTNEREQIELSAARLAAIQAAQHTNVMDNAATMLTAMVEVLSLQQIDDPECPDFLERWVSRDASFRSLALLDRGEVVCASDESHLPRGFPADDFLGDLQDAEALHVSEYTVDQEGRPLVLVALPIHDTADRLIGAAAVSIDLRWLEFLARRMDLPSDGTVTAIDGTGAILNHYRAAGTEQDSEAGPFDTVPEEALRQEIAMRDSGVVRGRTHSGMQRVFGFQKTDSGDLRVVVGMPQYLEFERYGAALRDTLGAPMAIMILALIAAAYASETLVTRWVRRLTGAANRMAEGDLDTRSNVPHSRYELGRLAAAFDSMAETIQRSQAEIRQRAENYRQLLSELNHRVNNNMQMIRSLLGLRSRRIEDVHARHILADLDERIASLTEIQRLLYDTEGADIIDAQYPQRLGDFLEQFYGSDAVRIDVEAEPAELSKATLVPLGLIMNELIANACKHAFGDGHTGHIQVVLRNLGDHVHLTVADDGKPIPDDVDFQRPGESLGLRIVQNMIAQLNGEFHVKQEDDGKSFHLTFPIKGRE